MTISLRNELSRPSTVVIKIGSRILTAPGYEQRMAALVEDINRLHADTVRVIIVSSGAIAHGMTAFNLARRPVAIPMQQACASIGQHRLMNAYDHAFSVFDVSIGQVLLTWDDLRSKKRYLNLRNTLFQLLDMNAIPIVNENDSVGTEEIQFGNNDMLGAQVALLAHAGLFVNLTDVRGLFESNPHINKNARHIQVVPAISSSFRKMAETNNNETSVGGMITKLKAAEMVTRAGVSVLIGDGFHCRLSQVLTEKKCATLFLPKERKMSSRHRWIAFTGQVHGSLKIDEGAEKALISLKKSLLSAGIRDVDGNFKAGDKVEIVSIADGSCIGRGLVNYSSDDIRTIRGCKSSEIKAKLGTKPFDEVIHRDNLVIL
jgi:glutamate 5-kinase